MKCNAKITGERISALRKKQGLKQVELAQRLSVSRQIISYYETGARMPNTEDIVLLAEFFNTTTDYLLGVSDVSSTNIDLKAVCDYTGLSEKAVKALHCDLSGSKNYYWGSESCTEIVSQIICNGKIARNIYRYVKCSKELSNYSILLEKAFQESADIVEIENINDKCDQTYREMRYAYFEITEALRDFLDNLFDRSKLDEKEFSVLLEERTNVLKAGEPNGNDNEAE